MELLLAIILGALSGALTSFLLMRFFYIPKIRAAIIPLYQALESAKKGALAVGGFMLLSGLLGLRKKRATPPAETTPPEAADHE